MGLPWWAGVLALIGSTFVIGWAVVKSYATHDWRTCQCVDCRKRSYHAHKNQGHHAVGVTTDGDIIWSDHPPPWAQSDIPPNKTRGDWLSTAELEPRMVVLLRGMAFRILDIVTDQKGYIIQMQPMGGSDRRLPVIVTVVWSHGNFKYWQPRDTNRQTRDYDWYNR